MEGTKTRNELIQMIKMDKSTSQHRVKHDINDIKTIKNYTQILGNLSCGLLQISQYYDLWHSSLYSQVLIFQTLISQSALLYQRICSWHFLLLLLLSQSKFSGTRKFTLSYQ